MLTRYVRERGCLPVSRNADLFVPALNGGLWLQHCPPESTGVRHPQKKVPPVCRARGAVNEFDGLRLPAFAEIIKLSVHRASTTIARDISHDLAMLSTGIFFHAPVLGCISLLEMIRDATILIRLTKEEKAQINKVARAAGGMVSEWVREALLEKAGIGATADALLKRMSIPAASNEVPKLDTAPVKVNGEPPLDIPEIPLNDPQPPRGDGGPFITEPSSGQSGPLPTQSRGLLSLDSTAASAPVLPKGDPMTDEASVESGYWLDGEWVPD